MIFSVFLATSGLRKSSFSVMSHPGERFSHPQPPPPPPPPPMAKESCSEPNNGTGKEGEEGRIYAALQGFLMTEAGRIGFEPPTFNAYFIC